MTATKVSISLQQDHVKWLRKAARRQRTTVSGLLAVAVERIRREEALDRVIAYLGDAAELTDADIKAIDNEWRG